MKLGGIGPIEAMSAVSRFDKTKSAGEAKASLASEKATEQSAALSSSLSSKTSKVASKSTPRSSDVSKQNTKDFSRVLNDEQKSFDADEETESNDLAASTAVAMQSSRPVNSPGSRPESRPEKLESMGETKLAGVSGQRDQTSPTAEAGIASGEEATTVDEKINDIVESLEQTADTELSMRHISMREFLGKMEGEFGIEPQQIVKAFANLDQSAMQASPDATAGAVLAQLGLKPEQMPKAEALYREMLNQTGESALNETMAGVGAGVTLKVLSEQDLAMDKLQKSIVNLNDSFARRDQVAPEIVASPLALVGEESTLVAKPETEIAEKKDAKNGDSKFASLGAALSAASAALAGASSDGTRNGAGGSGSNPKDSETPKSKEFNSIESALAASGFSVSNTAEKAATPLMAGTSTAAALATAAAGQDGEGSASNAQNLVRNAQILMKNGGGEMKMQLKPEGVGEVTLKVAVKDGQVAIQMMTENDSAKKLLESNLDDLKTSLAQHKLHVDALKIEVGSDLSKQRFEQAQQDSSRDQARQMAQDFMGQFRDDRQGFRGSFFDQSGFKNYQQPKQNTLPTVEPVVTSSGSQQKSASGERRLNLVA